MRAKSECTSQLWLFMVEDYIDYQIERVLKILLGLKFLLVILMGIIFGDN